MPTLAKDGIEALNEELQAFGLNIDGEAFLWLVLEILVSHRKLLSQDVTRRFPAAETNVSPTDDTDLYIRKCPSAGPQEHTVAEYTAMLADALSIRDTARRLAVHPETVRRRLRLRSLFGIRLRGRWLLPMFQFEGGQVLPGMEEVMSEIRPEAHPVVLRFFVTPQCDLVAADVPKPVSPREWLLTGHSWVRVAALARGLSVA